MVTLPGKFWKAGSAGIMRALQFSSLARGLIVCCVVCFLGCATTQPFGLSLDGERIDPLREGKNNAVVLIFVSNDCPISNRYAPEIQRLKARFTPHGVWFWLVHPDPDENPADIREHDRQYGLDLPVLRDPKYQLVRLARAKVTPSAALFVGDQLVYCGRIDDRLSDFRKERPEATQHDLADSIEVVLDHRPVVSRETKAIGCYIPAPR